MALEAELRYHSGKKCHEKHEKNHCCSHEALGRPHEVDVTIGLFSIIKLFRIVDLSVQSRGFSIPEECEEISSVDPCEYFDNLAFPMDIFAPPQKPEFFAGISGDIPHKDHKHHKCHKEDSCCHNHK